MSLLLRRRMLLSQAKGTLPSKYQQVKYIESTSDGGDYINTLFFANQDTRIVAKFQMIDATKGCFVFGARNAQKQAFTVNIGGTPRNFVFAYNTSGNQNIILADTNEHIVDFNKNVCTFDTIEKTLTSTTFKTSSPIALFACNDSSVSNGHLPAYMRLFKCQIYDNGELVRNYIPCYRTSDKVAGLYDLVNKEFVTTTKGAFVTPKQGADI